MLGLGLGLRLARNLILNLNLKPVTLNRQPPAQSATRGMEEEPVEDCQGSGEGGQKGGPKPYKP